MAEEMHFALKESPASKKLRPTLSEPIVAEHEARLEGIHQFFAEEQKLGEAVLRKRQRFWTVSHEQQGGYADVVEAARRLREKADVVVVVGIGGSDLAARVAHAVLDCPYHNLHVLAGKDGPPPELYFAGNTFDPAPMHSLLDMLDERGLLDRTGVVVVSKSGKTLETACALSCLAGRLGPDWIKRTVVVTGSKKGGSLLARLKRPLARLPVQDGVGGRFSGHTEVGLLPFLVTSPGEDGAVEDRLAQAMAGVSEAYRRFFTLPTTDAANVAFSLASWLHLERVYGEKSTLVVYNFADDGGALGAWFLQLFSESIQEQGGGLDVIAASGPTSNHSLANGIVRGPRNKVVLFLRWRELGSGLKVPEVPGLEETIPPMRTRDLGKIQDICYRAVEEDFAANGVPCITLELGRRDPAHLFGLFRLMMDTVAVLGKLADLDRGADGKADPEHELTYRQDGVEGYKAGMHRLLSVEKK